MQALVYTAPGRVELEQRPRPVPQTGEEEIAIEVAGVCGSDLSGFLGHSALRRPPLVLGHELVGRRPDGQREVANPLVSCGHCEASILGAQNLCESWKLLGLGTAPGTFAEYVALRALGRNRVLGLTSNSEAWSIHSGAQLKGKTHTCTP